MPTRRERRRRETVRDIKTTALAHLREHGAVGLSLRAIARDLDMSAPGLYRYFDSRDRLLTALIADGYHDLADHLVVAIGREGDRRHDSDRPDPRPPRRCDPDDDVAERLLAAAAAYRDWARAHPNQFGLLYGDPIPGYVAPPGGETTTANLRIGGAFMGLLLEAHEQGRLRRRAVYDHAGLSSIEMPIAGADVEVPGWVLAAGLLSWARLHGVVALEHNGQYAFLYGDDAAPLFDAEMAALVADLGM